MNDDYVVIFSKSVSKGIFRDYDGSNPEISYAKVLAELYLESIGLELNICEDI